MVIGVHCVQLSAHAGGQRAVRGDALHCACTVSIAREQYSLVGQGQFHRPPSSCLLGSRLPRYLLTYIGVRGCVWCACRRLSSSRNCCLCASSTRPTSRCLWTCRRPNCTVLLACPFSGALAMYVHCSRARVSILFCTRQVHCLSVSV